MRRTVTLTLVGAAFALSACGSQKQACMVLTSGSQVCGPAAAAWCQMTSGDRANAIANTDPLQNFGQDQMLARTADDCAAIEKRYSGG